MGGLQRRRGRVEFNRPPRLRSVLPVDEIRIPNPPTPPAGTTASLIGALLIPMISVLATSSVFILFALSNPLANQTLMLLATSALIIGAVLPTSYTYFAERRRGPRDWKQLESAYQRRLDARRNDLLALRD